MRKLAVYTVTHNRLEYTKKAFASLRKKAGCEYDHYVFDNGSTDGTTEWLHEQDDIILLYNSKNVGQHVAANELLRTIREKGDYTHVLRFDNDCFIESDDLLKQLLDASEWLDNKAIISPHVNGLDWNPDRFGEKKTDKYNIGFVDIIGGICRLHPLDVIKDFWFDVRQPLGFGEASQIARFCQKNVVALIYIENLFVNHGKSTQDQIKDAPDYFVSHACLQRYPYVPPLGC